MQASLEECTFVGACVETDSADVITASAICTAFMLPDGDKVSEAKLKVVTRIDAPADDPVFEAWKDVVVHGATCRVYKHWSCLQSDWCR